MFARHAKFFHTLPLFAALVGAGCQGDPGSIETTAGKGVSGATTGSNDDAQGTLDSTGETPEDGALAGMGGGNGGSGTGASESTGGSGNEEEPLVCEGVQAPRQRLLHLTAAQYDRTLSQLFGSKVELAEAFPDDERVAGFASPSRVDSSLARQWWDAADAAAALVLNDAAGLFAHVGVCATVDDPQCVQDFVTEWGLRAFRRPLLDEELSDYIDLYEAEVEDGNAPEAAVSRVVQAMLASPQFLFRPEPSSQGADPEPLGDYALAARLSFFLWGTAPDELLLDDAALGALSDRDVLEAHVDRMLADERATWAVRDFISQWLELDRLDLVSFAPELLNGTTMTLPWDHDSVYFGPADGDGPRPPTEEIAEKGWFVWDIPPAEVTRGYATAKLTLSATVDADDEPLELSVNLNDDPLIGSLLLAGGAQVVDAEINIQAGQPLKLGVHVKNATADRSVHFESLQLSAGVPLEELRESMKQQIIKFYEDTTLGGGTYEQLMTSATLPVDGNLAGLMGVDVPGTDFVATSFDEGERRGLLTLPGVLAAHGGLHSGGTSPIKRGTWLLERMLCVQHPPPLPMLPDYCASPCDAGCTDGYECQEGLCVAASASECDADADCSSGMACHTSGHCIADPSFCIPTKTLDQTTRQWWDSFQSACHGCHEQINGLGYALEHYDGLGRFRDFETTSEGDEAIDASGLLRVGTESTEIYGADGLVQEMMRRDLGAPCYAESWFVYAFGQIADGHLGAACTQQSISQQFTQSEGNLLSLLKIIALSDGFSHTAPTEQAQE